MKGTTQPWLCGTTEPWLCQSLGTTGAGLCQALGTKVELKFEPIRPAETLGSR